MFLCKIVSLVSAKTCLMFSVSMAVVKWWNMDLEASLVRLLNISTSNFLTSSNLRESEVDGNVSGKYSLISERRILPSNKSILLKNKIIETLSKVLLLTMASKTSHDSISLLVFLSSSSTWSYSLDETRKRMQVTPSKHWYHFCLCDRCPPTSTKRNKLPLMLNSYSRMLRVKPLACRMSWLLGL